MALMTPKRLCVIVSAQRKLRPARQLEHWATNRGGNDIIPGACVPRASVEFSIWKLAKNLLVFGAMTTQPVENRLARPISNPPSSRRA